MIDWDQVITPAHRLAERMIDARGLRDASIAASVWLLERHRGQMELDSETSITLAQYTELLTYHQTLRNWPAQEGWPDIDMPLEPAWLANIKK